MPLTARQRSIHNKNGTKRSASFKGKKSGKGNEGEYLVTNAPSDLRSIAYPGGAVTLGLLLTARVTAALWGLVNDCDETYNYWEPLHYLVYGTGLQTWEYSPQYAIRSYASLWLFAVPAKILSLVLSPVSVFYALKIILAVLYAAAELIFYKAICHEYGVHVGRVWLGLSLPCAGTLASSPALLPSAWGAPLAAAALGCGWRKRYRAAVAFVAVSAFLGWPFTAILGLPIAIDMVFFKRKYWEFIKYSVICTICILLPMIVIDSWHYGRLVIAPWNIIAYNMFTQHGPDLYGVEPWTYYFVNGFLNFNIVWVLALSSPVLLLACTLVSPRSTSRAAFVSPYWLGLLPLALWLAVFVLQPHKEERFLYPVYPLILLSGAISIDCIQKLTFAVGTELFRWRKERERRHYLPYTGPLVILILAVATIGGLSRTISQLNNYRGPMTILSHLPPTSVPQVVCFGKEWYRSPSSFHLPTGYSVRFVPTQFDGQMPAPYDSGYNATRLIKPHFNDLNKGDNSTYVDPSQCDYLVDSDIGSPTTLQPAYHKDFDTWDIFASTSLLNAEKSHRLYRAFYIPGLSERHNVFGNLFLLKNKLSS